MNEIKFLKVGDKPFCFKDESIFRLACYVITNPSLVVVSDRKVLITHIDNGITHSLVVSSDNKVLLDLKKSRDAAQLYRLCCEVVNTKEKDDY